MTASSASKSSVSERVPEPGRLHLWLCRTDIAARLDAGVLTAAERERYRNRREARLGRVVLRHLLSRYEPVEPAAWRFETGRHGKPALRSRSLEFNLSHSGQWLALAVSRDAPVGVDVQELDRERNLRRIARRYFSEPELAELEAMRGEAYVEHFYRLWSLKEAWTKAAGGALPTALGRIGFSLADGSLASLAPGLTRGSSLWLLDLEGYSLAVCALGERLGVECRQLTGAGPDEWLPAPARAVTGMS